jgi:predicted nucleic acid-binding protein
MKIIVDTNIIFSALLNSNGSIGDLLFNSSSHFEFYSCSYMRIEIVNHWERLKKISKLNDNQLDISQQRIVSKLKFIDEAIIPSETWLKSEVIASGIDLDDTDFIALTKFLKGTLWTGDKVLYNGLKRKDFKRVINTKELLELRKMKSEK